MTNTKQPDTGELTVDQLQATAAAVRTSSSLEELTRPFLDLLTSITGLESTYLTEVRPEVSEQEILYSLNQGQLQIGEGLVVNWQDTVCRRALESNVLATDDVERDLPGSQLSQDLGLMSYVSVPVADRSERLLGTLCGASGHSRVVSEQAQDVMKLLARLIADQWQRDLEHLEVRRRAEHAEERLRSRALFLAEAEHKLKTPLTIIRGWSDILTDDWAGLAEPQRHRAVATIREASIKAANQVDELLHEARSEVLSNQLTIERLDLVPMVEKVTAELAGGTKTHTVGFARHIDSAAIRGDATALWQILWHLGDNALKYSPESTSVWLDVQRVSAVIEVSVIDEGPGLPSDVDATALFEPFTRSASNKGVAGSGLGLHIVRNLVQAMDGEVSAHNNTSGIGARFVVKFPACG